MIVAPGLMWNKVLCHREETFGNSTSHIPGGGPPVEWVRVNGKTPKCPRREKLKVP